MWSTSRNFAAILRLLLVAVKFGGGSLLNLLTRRISGYLDNPRVAAMRRRSSARSSSGTSTRKGRISMAVSTVPLMTTSVCW
jgi:hypothetical protein